VIWERFGKVQNYVEPFFGSGAVLLARPAPLSTETVNDADGFLCNFWRALQAEPDVVARWADWPVNEADLHARHYWLVTEGAARVAAVIGKPDGYDAQVAGWWVWGICAFIGSGFCTGAGPWQWQGDQWGKKENGEVGVPIQIPHMGDAGRGINRKLPHMGNAGQGIADMFAALSQRLRSVRVAHGDWTRVCGDSVTWRHGKTAVFLDPPYDGYEGLYTEGEASISTAVREWAIEAGKRKDMLICLAGYADEHALPDGWTVHRWKARGGFGSQSDKQGRENSALETLWFSPACNPPRQETLL
jgi:hypothetical protein